MPTRFPLWARITLVACVVIGLGCAEERPAINRVQPNAFEKSFFIGKNLSDPSDDPEFYYRPTVVDVDYGAKQPGLFTASYAQTLARVGWEVTEDLLIARLRYQQIEDTSGKGSADDDAGQIVAAFKIQSHFDVRYQYNPSTGEELNIVEENTTDRPWYEREAMHVDFSQNLVTSAYQLDTLAALRAYSGNSIEYEAASYSIEDPKHEDAPVWDEDRGYLDVTNRVFAKPQMVETPWGAYPACFLSPEFLGGTGPNGNCNPVELKIRLAFKQVTDTDYEPVDWDGQRHRMFGAFTTGTTTPTRLGYDRKYGVVDSKWYRFVNRHNIWTASHLRDQDGKLKACSATNDACSTTPGSHCDPYVGACTIPLRDRTTKPVVYFYGPGSDPSLFDSVKLATDDWDSALRHAVQTGRYAECVRERGGVANDAAIEACQDEYPPSLEAAIENVPQILYFCHNPVIEGDPAECGAPKLLARVGDLRYHMANIIEAPQTPQPWGIMSDASDPVTGEIIASSVNIWNAATDLITQKTIDLARWYMGELTSEEIERGTYVKPSGNIGLAPGQRTLYRGPSLLSNDEVNQRFAAMDRSLSTSEPIRATLPANGSDLVDWASDQTRRIFGATALGQGNTGIQSRFLAAQNSPVEAELTTQPFLSLVGLERTAKLDDKSIQLASPLRATFWQNRSILERERQIRLADIGRCVLDEAAQPSNVADLGEMLVRKFPAGERLPGTGQVSMTAAELTERNQKIADYLRKRFTRSVMAHEMGHSMGLRHTFTSNVDAINFRPQYWQLRTRDKRETTYCTDPTDDGSSCIGPRWKDPVTEEERAGLLTMWQHTTVMDYPGDLSQDLLGIGPYDRAAIRFIYTDVTDIWATPGDQCSEGLPGNFTCSRRAQLLADRQDDFGGLLGPLYGLSLGTESIRHYSQLDQELDLIKNCEATSTAPPEDWDEDADGIYDPVLDGHVVNGTKCRTPPVDYVGYADLRVVDTQFRGPMRKFDELGRVRWPYMFADDRYADLGNVAVFRHDNGADPYEIASFLINEYEDIHVFDNHRRGRTTFSILNAFEGAYRRYHEKLRDISKSFAYLNEIFSGTNLTQLYTEEDFSDGLARPIALASSLAFDHFTRMLTRPTSGVHFVAPRDAAGNVILRSDDQAYVANDPTGRELQVTVPEGTDTPGFAPSLGGRPLHNSYDETKGYHSVDYDLWVGSYYEKTLALDLLQDSTDRFVSQSRDDFHDGRYRNVSFATLYPDAMRRLVANTLTGDADLLGWRVPTRANGLPQAGKPRQPMGFPLWWPVDGPTTCWPAPGSLGCSEPSAPLVPGTSMAIDPEVGFEVQKFIAFFSLIYLPESWKRDWVDLMRIYRVGADPEPSFPAEESIVYRDPLSGEKYVAHSLGKELILGREVQQAIGARMLEWANTLASQAYQVESVDPMTGELTYARHADDTACPTSLDCTGHVVTNPNSAIYQTRIKGYQSLIDFVRLVTARLGFYGPGWRGIF